MKANNQNLKKLISLKEEAGNHSPSLKEIESVLGKNIVRYDACFLSNPYATKLIYKSDFSKIINENLYKIVESYPPNQKYILDLMSKIEKTQNNNTVVFNGAQLAIEILMSKLQYKNCLIPIPTFSSYFESIKKDSTYHFLNLEEENSFKANETIFMEEIRKKKIDLLILINPNNPTGVCYSKKFINKIIKEFPDLNIIIDESFIHFIEDLNAWIDFKKNALRKNQNIFFVKSLSKDFGIAGLRIGYLQSNHKIMDDIKSKFSTWGLNNFAIEALEIMSSSDFIGKYSLARTNFLESKKIFFKELSKIKNFKTYNSDSNFYLIKPYKKIDNGFISAMKLLIDTGLYIRSMEDKVGLGKQFFRIASRTKAENKIIIKILKSYEF
jgi:histidinol-phosphate/aromatic aminotransferase/cobyric acid decarboxylase-like protein